MEPHPNVPGGVRGDDAGRSPDDLGESPHEGEALVGREGELRQLLRGVEDALSGRGGLFLVVGEPGIGKTRLAVEVADESQRRGARVLWGRCWEAGGAPAYWPWIQSIRAYVRSVDPEVLKGQLGSSAASVALIVPEVRRLVSDLPELPSLESDGARFRMFEDVAGFLWTVARDQPLVLILDDLHAADMPSLLLLRFALRDLITAPVLVLALSRNVDREDPLRSAWSELLREPGSRRLDLTGLGEPDVARLILSVTGHVPPARFVEFVSDATEGNPLFVTEVVRLLADQGRLDPSSEGDAVIVTEGVRDVIGQRLRRLSDECIRVLTLASVLGREFELEALRSLAQVARDDLLGLIDEAVSRDVLSELPGVLGRRRFAHVLIRDALYEELGSAQRIELHRKAGEVLEGLYGDDAEPHLSELAHHFVRAAQGGDADTAIDYARRAGDRAAGLLAFEEATRFYRMALQLLGSRGRSDDESRCDLLLAAGESQARGGDHAAAQATFLEAAAAARRSKRPDLVGSAALGYAGRFVWPREGDDRRLVPLLEEALEGVGEDDGPLRARLLARLSGALRDREPRELARDISERAVEMARRIGDPATLSYALEGRFGAAWWPENPEERLAIGSEIIRLAEETGDLERTFQGHDARVCALIDLGEIADVDLELEAERLLVEELRQPAQLWLFTHTRAMRALMDGRFDEAEHLIEEALPLGERAQRWQAVFVHRTQSFLLRKEQGRLGEMEPIIRRSVVEYPTRYLFPSLLAYLYAELDRRAEARTAFETLAADDFAPLRMDSDYLLALSLLCEVVEYLGDVRRAELMYRRLLPFAGRVASTGEACTGSVARCLGILASVTSRFEDSDRHFEAALVANERMGARPWASHTRVSHARMLLSRDDPGDHERATMLLADASRTCEELGMVALRAKITSMVSTSGLQPIPDRGRASAALAGPGNRPNVFRKEGEYWTIAFEGDAFRLRDSKGLRHLAALFGDPGREVLALELTTSAGGTDGRSVRTSVRELGLHAGSSDAGPLLDARAKAEYRRRLTELEQELSEAESWADPDRAAKARVEIDLLERELATAVGLGGRDRHTSSDAERARVSVTKSIKSAMERIREHSPSLARHLASTIHTGTFCSYTPDSRLPAAWQL